MSAAFPAAAPDRADGRRRGAAWICVALALLVVAAYEPVRRNGFVTYDDGLYVSENPWVARGLTWDGLRWALTAQRAGNWHPLTWISHMLDVQLFGMTPSAFHLVNLAIHAANTALVFLVLDRATGARGPSAFVAAVFGVHPLHVESVAWIAERKDVLSTFFLLVALAAYVAYARRPSATRYVAVASAFALGLLAKPMVVTFPFVLLLLDWWPLRRTATRSPWALVREKLPLFAMSAASCVATFLAQRRGGAVMGTEALPFADRLLNAPTAYVAYVGKTLWPTNLAALYPLHRESLRATTALAAAALVVGVGVGVAAWRTRVKRPYFLVGWLWFVGTLVPVIGLVQVGVQSMADRYMYVPLIGLAVVAAWGVADFVAGRAASRVAAIAAASAIVVACVLATRDQIGHWKDGAALWTRAADVTEGNVVAHVNLGGIAFREGRLDDAVREFEEALRIAPDSAVAHEDWGLVLLAREQFDAARAQFAEAVRLDPRYAEAHVNLGVALQDLGRLDEAIAATSEAVRIDPKNAAWRLNVAFLLQAKGDLVAAARAFDEALRLDPSNAQARRARDELAARGVR